MKRLLLLFSVFMLTSCSRGSGNDDVEPVVDPVYGSNLGILHFQSFKEEATGNEYFTPSVFYLWKTENRDLDPTKDTAKLISGKIFDKKSNTYVSADFASYKEAYFTEKIPAGKYFVYTNLGDQIPRYAWSTTTIEIKYKQDLNLQKIWTTDTKALMNNPW